LLRRNAQRVPDREALVDPPNLTEISGSLPQRLSWAELDARVECLAGVLALLGWTTDDVVVVQMVNSHEVLVLYLACWRLGVVVSPMVAQAREHEIAQAIERTGARALVVSQSIGAHDHAAMAIGLSRGLAEPVQVLTFGAGPIPADVVDLRQRMRDVVWDIDAAQAALDRLARARPVTADDAVTVIWTSGSEGRPKGVGRTHNDWLLYGPQFGADFGIGDGIRLLNGRPLCTHGAFVGTITPWLWHAGTLVNHHPFSLPIFLAQLRQEHIGFTALAPAILSSLLARPEQLVDIDFQQLRCIGSGSAPLSESLVRGFREQFGVEVINFFGSTEGASLVSGPPDMPDAAARAQYFPRLGAAGQAWKHPAHALVETRLVDLGTGADIEAPGLAGEIRFRGPMVMSGYFRDPELTASAFDAQGWYCTGDLFELAGDRGQYLRYAGRVKDVIVRGGFNLSASEIERLVASHPSVLEVAVVGYADARLGERVCACVVPRLGHVLTLEDLTRHLREACQVSVLKLPERLMLLEEMPRSPNQKVLKGVLRERAAQMHAPEPAASPPREPRSEA
jgi:acyl-CoA synthetase (AMP-forming)/AMP-acid ligase II